jgi:hypothetical protein
VELDLGLIDDVSVEETETFKVMLLSQSDALHVGPYSEVTITVTDDDSVEVGELPVVEFNRSGLTLLENDTLANGRWDDFQELQIVRRGQLDRAIDVRLHLKSDSATEGEDYILSKEEIHFAPNEDSKQLPLEILDDFLAEGPESLELELVPILEEVQVGEKSSATIQIEDDEIPIFLDPGFRTVGLETIKRVFPRKDGSMIMMEESGGLKRLHANGKVDTSPDLDQLSSQLKPDDGATYQQYVESIDEEQLLIAFWKYEQENTTIRWVVYHGNQSDEQIRLLDSKELEGGFVEWMQLGRDQRLYLLLRDERFASGKAHFYRFNLDGSGKKLFPAAWPQVTEPTYIGFKDVTSDLNGNVILRGTSRTTEKFYGVWSTTDGPSWTIFYSPEGENVSPAEDLLIRGRFIETNEMRQEDFLVLNDDGLFSYDSTRGAVSLWSGSTHSTVVTDWDKSYGMASMRGSYSDYGDPIDSHLLLLQGDLINHANHLESHSIQMSKIHGRIHDAAWTIDGRLVIAGAIDLANGMPVNNVVVLDLETTSRSYVELEYNDSVISEESGVAQWYINRQGDLQRPLDVSIELDPMIDEDPRQLKLLEDQYHFEPGESRIVVNLRWTSDHLPQDDLFVKAKVNVFDDAFSFSLDDFVNTIRIRDDDGPDSLDLSWDVSVGKGSIQQMSVTPAGEVALSGSFTSVYGIPGFDGQVSITSDGYLSDETVHCLLQYPDGRWLAQRKALDTYVLERRWMDGRVDDSFTSVVYEDPYEEAVKLGNNSLLLYRNVSGQVRYPQWKNVLMDRDGGDMVPLETFFERPDDEGFVRSLSVDEEGRVVFLTRLLRSSHDWALVRYLSNGMIDASFGEGGKFNLPFEDTDWVFHLRGGTILVSGTVREPDQSFAPQILSIGKDNLHNQESIHHSLELDGQVVDAVAQKDGKIYLGGTFTTIDGHPTIGLARLLSDGFVDRDFQMINHSRIFEEWGSDYYFGERNGTIRDLALTNDGYLYVVGDFDSFENVRRGGIVRLLGEYILHIANSGMTPDKHFFVEAWTRRGYHYELQKFSGTGDWVVMSTGVGNGSLLRITTPVISSDPRSLFRLKEIPIHD